jgi:hypothetical protein
MKRIGTTGVVVAFLSAATTALAACASCPAGVQQESPLSQESPNMNMSAARQAPRTYLAAASQEDRHRDHSACAVYTPDWPYSVPGP